MKKGKLFITLLSFASLLEHIVLLCFKCLKSILGLLYFAYRLFVLVLLWAYYYSARALLIFVQVFSFPVNLIISIFILISYANSKKIGIVEATIDASKNGLSGFVDGKKMFILCFVLSALIYYIIYKLFFP